MKAGAQASAHNATVKVTGKHPAIVSAELAVAKAEQQLVWAKEALAQAKKENG
jgi:hypothetical protein